VYLIFFFFWFLFSFLFLFSFFVFTSFFVVIQELVHDDIDSSSMKCIQKKETKIQKNHSSKNEATSNSKKITPPKMKQHQIQKKSLLQK